MKLCVIFLGEGRVLHSERVFAFFAYLASLTDADEASRGYGLIFSRRPLAGRPAVIAGMLQSMPNSELTEAVGLSSKGHSDTVRARAVPEGHPVHPGQAGPE